MTDQEIHTEGYEIFKSISEKKPEFMLWLGDNTYLRDPDFIPNQVSSTGIIHKSFAQKFKRFLPIHTTMLSGMITTMGPTTVTELITTNT